MAARLVPGSIHQLRSKSRIARSRSESAIQGSLPILPPRIKHLAPGGPGGHRYAGVSDAGVAQLVAQATCNRQVVGSSPTAGSKGRGLWRLSTLSGGEPS